MNKTPLIKVHFIFNTQIELVYASSIFCHIPVTKPCIFGSGGAEDEKMIAICLLTTMSFSTLVGCDVKDSNTVQESKIKKQRIKNLLMMSIQRLSR